MTPILANLQQTALVVGGANAVGFALTAGFQMHHLTDLVGVGSFVLATARLSSINPAFQLKNIPDSRLVLVNLAVGVWGTRLASYLFHRILHIHEDKRLNKFFPQPGEGFFDRTKSNFPIGLGMFWSIQALWGMICLLPVTLLNAAPLDHVQLSLQQGSQALQKAINLPGGIAKMLVCLPILGMGAGLAIEAIADYQKYKFRSNAANDGKWCDVGLWSMSRYPNYFGEMLFWWSVYASSLPVLASLFPASTNLWAKVGPAALGLLSPVFCTFLLTKVSGIPIHERNQKAKFGKNADYLKYVQNTPLLLPLPGLLRRDKQA